MKPKRMTVTGAGQNEEELPMYERAAQRQKDSQAKVEKLRREKFENEMKLQRAPRISVLSKKLNGASQSTIAERMEKLETSKKKKMAKLIEEKEAKEMAEMTGKPTLVSSGRKQKEMEVYTKKEVKVAVVVKPTVSDAFQERQAATLKKKEDKIKEELEKKKIEEMKECNFSPKIPDSKQILEAAKKKKEAALVALIQEEALKSPDKSKANQELYALALSGDIHARLAVEASEKKRREKEMQDSELQRIKKLASPNLEKNLDQLSPKGRETNAKTNPKESPVVSSPQNVDKVSPKAVKKEASPVSEKKVTPDGKSPTTKRASKWGSVKTEMVDKPKEEKRKSKWFGSKK